MTDYPNQQNNPAAAIPVYVVAGTVGGWDYDNITTSTFTQVKDGEGTLSTVNTNTGGTTSAVTLFDGYSSVVTITIATPGVVSWVGHGLVAGDLVVFQTTSALPTGLTAGTTYHVIAGGLTADAFRVSATAGGSAINTSGSQSGVQTAYKTTNTIATLPTTGSGTQGPSYYVAFTDGLIAKTTDGGGAADITVLFA